MKKILTIASFLVIHTALCSQDSTLQKLAPFQLGVFADAYYAYDFNKPASNNRPGFIYSHNRHNEFNVNLAYIKGSYAGEMIRGNIALAAGTYMNANYSAEPGVLKNIMEANAGVKISRKHNLWVDIGILPSHIGFESAHSPSCWTLTRSLLADNSPYFESGARLSYTSKNEKWQLRALALNGWQRITRVEGNSLMSGGVQVNFKPRNGIQLNYSNFIGTDKPDSSRQMRYFHNLYAILEWGNAWGLIVGFDFGQEQVAKNSSRLNTWFSPVAIVRYAPAGKWAFACRGEYYSDENGVIIASPSPDGFKTFGISFNADRKITENCLWRTEVRSLFSQESIFPIGASFSNNNTTLATSIAITF